MKCFFVDGKQKSLARVLSSIGGGELIVSTFGVNKSEVFSLFGAFKRITVVIDRKITKRNDNKALNILLLFAEKSKKLKIRTLGSTHFKISIIDRSKIIFTSANLQKNQNEEFYMIADFNEIDGAEQIKDRLLSAEEF